MLTTKLKEVIINLEKSSSLQFEENQKILNETLKSVYNEASFANLSVKQILKALDEVLEFCKESSIENPKVLCTILKCWTHDDDDIDGVLGDIIANIHCKALNIKYLCETLSSLTSPLSILDVHILSRHSDAGYFGFVAERVLNFFNLSNLQDFEWDHLLETCKKFYSQSSSFNPQFYELQSNPVTRDGADILEYIELKKSEASASSEADEDVCPKPDYVNLLEGENVEYYESLGSELSESRENPDDSHQNLKALLKKYLKIPEAPILDPGDIAQPTVDEVIDMYLSTKSNNTTIKNTLSPERYFGPINAFVDDLCCSTPQNRQCSMFYCMCRELDEEEVELNEIENFQSIATSWFSGMCEHCNRKIKKMRYAVRYPVEGGGFIGCFCSFNCIYASKKFPIYDNDDLRVQEINYVLKFNKVTDL